MINCKYCGHEIAKSAKSCPQCGAKNKKPIYKRIWFWVIIVLLIAAASTVGTSDSKEDITPPTAEQTNEVKPSETLPPAESTPVEITYETVDIKTLFDDLDTNALKAEKTYEDKYIEITGRLTNIDSDGSYISIGVIEDDNLDYLFDTIRCEVINDVQLDIIMELAIDDIITIQGQIDDIGEIVGYSLDIATIAKD